MDWDRRWSTQPGDRLEAALATLPAVENALERCPTCGEAWPLEVAQDVRTAC